MTTLQNPRPDVLLVTYSKLPNLSSDDRPLLSALQEAGIDARPAVWDDPAVEWESARLVVLRSTWDYHLRHEEFMAWAEPVAAATQLWNPIEAVRWNSHKGYLRDLERQGIPIVPTVWLDAGSQADLGAIMREQNWQQAVVKPVVSASAFGTRIVAAETLDRAQADLDLLLAQREMMVQPFLTSVETYGEPSLMFIDGHFTHAVLRHSYHKVSSGVGRQGEPLEPPDEALELAARILRIAGFPSLYARVDLVHDLHGELCLMELELIEPSLFLGYSPHAIELFSRAILSRL